MDKEVFERMISEFKELNERVSKCRDFILDKEKFEALDMINRDLLIAQLKAMETYLSILSIRLGINGTLAVPETEDKENTEDSQVTEESSNNE